MVFYGYERIGFKGFQISFMFFYLLIFMFPFIYMYILHSKLLLTGPCNYRAFMKGLNSTKLDRQKRVINPKAATRGVKSVS